MTVGLVAVDLGHWALLAWIWVIAGPAFGWSKYGQLGHGDNADNWTPRLLPVGPGRGCSPHHPTHDEPSLSRPDAHGARPIFVVEIFGLRAHAGRFPGKKLHGIQGLRVPATGSHVNIM